MPCVGNLLGRVSIFPSDKFNKGKQGSAAIVAALPFNVAQFGKAVRSGSASLVQLHCQSIANVELPIVV